MGPHKGLADDLATLGDLDEQALLEHLNYRFRRDVIYTYIGDILVSINPYKPISGLYGVEVGQRYGRAKSLNELKPHVYALGSRVFHNVQRGQGNQCVLVSGESGAGKTEITKMLVAQISRLSQWDGEHFLQDRIIEVNPLLEAFGNASTMLNDNSSRFGKLIELVFTDSGSLLGARITEHMLEKSRISSQSQGEKNFHIFYNLMCGLTPEERKRYFLDVPERYRIIDPGHGAPVIATDIDHQGYAESMKNLRRIMPVVGFTHQDMDVVFALLAAILHLCNIEMAPEPESDEVIVMNEEEIDYAAVLLSVNAEDLVTCMLANVNWVRGERLVYIKSLHQAVDGRDALAKALYSKLFSWIVQQINSMLQEDERMEGQRVLVSVLDMAGFENFPHNSFEQLCINAANERLQHFFNEHIFTLELQEYQAEGVKQPKVKVTNNSELLNMLYQKPMGLFSLLEEECSLAKTSDMSLVDKLNKHCGVRQDLYRKSKHREPVFGIVHYAGLVMYNAAGFLEKNRDTLSTNMQSLMENSQNNLVNELFTAAVLETGTLDMRKGSDKNNWKRQDFQAPEHRQYSPGDSLSRQAGRKIRQKMKEQNAFHEIPVTTNPTSSSAHFKNSLHFLMERLRGAETQFIRCIKPNAMKRPIQFDTRLVVEQLRNTGIMETVKIRRLGYPVRLPFAAFIQRYKLLAFPLSSNVDPTPQNCIKLLKSVRVSDCPIGNSKVFMKHWHCDQMNAMIDDCIARIVRLQAVIEMRLCRQQFLHLRQLSKRDHDDVFLFGEHVASYGALMCQTLEGQNLHDIDRARQVHSNGYHDNLLTAPQSVYLNGSPQREPGRELRMPDVFSPHALGPGPSKLEGSEGFYKYIIDQVLTKLPEFDSDVWCKVLYMEYDRPVAKFYICDREVVIDGSTDEFTGKKIGLGVFKNAQRTEETSAIRSFIGKGIQIKKDIDGSITACRLGKNHVFVKGWQDPANHCLSADVVKSEGLLPGNQPVKVFDMDEFRSHMGIMLRSDTYDPAKLQRLSVCGLTFLQEAELDLATPCWLCIISIAALQMIDSPDIKKEVQQRFVQMSLQDDDKLEEQQNLQIAAERHQRNWSKLNLKQTENLKREPLRKTRLQIVQQGQKVQDRMDYSWDDKNYDQKGRQRNMAELQEDYDRFEDNESIMPGSNVQGGMPRAHSIASSAAFTDVSKATRKEWAKVKVTVKQDTAHAAETEQKSRVSSQLN